METTLLTSPFLADYRQEEFNPEFQYLTNYGAAADRINSFHPDDYPKYVPSTIQSLHDRLNAPWPGSGWPEAADLQALHQDIFQGSKPSEWRKVNVVVGGRLEETILPKGSPHSWLTDNPQFYVVRQVKGGHRPPQHEAVPELMNRLLTEYRPQPINRATVTQWYRDFETIHPFVDGNGRVGGCVVALLSHYRRFKLGQFLTPQA